MYLFSWLSGNDLPVPTAVGRSLEQTFDYAKRFLADVEPEGDQELTLMPSSNATWAIVAASGECFGHIVEDILLIADRPDAAAHAKVIEDAALQWLISGLNVFANSPNMVERYKQDYANLMAVATDLRDGNVRSARDRALALDTIVRDLIPPEAAWQFLKPAA